MSIFGNGPVPRVSAAAESAHMRVSESLEKAIKVWDALPVRNDPPEEHGPDFSATGGGDPGAIAFRNGAWKAAWPEIAAGPRIKGEIPDRREVELDRTLAQIATLTVRADRLVTGR